MVLALIFIIFATIQDLRKREVADWISFSLIVFALGFRLFYSLFNDNFSFFYQGLIGLGIFFVLGILFYYTHLFAGGDAKLMIALGTILPISNSFFENLNIFITFLLIFLFFGAIYGVSWSIVLSLRNFDRFKIDFFKRLNHNKKFSYILMAVGIIFMLFGFLQELLFFMGILFFIIPFIYIYAKSVDETCMIKKVNSKDLTEGDWLYQDLNVGKKKLEAKWDGLSKEEIKLIQKNHKFVLIRQGIPFVPVFLFSFLILILLLFIYSGYSSW